MRESMKRGYVQSHLLGKGAFSEVFKVTYDGIDYALKRIYNDSIINPTYCENINRQIQIMKKLDHPRIVKLYDVFQSEKELELLLEYVSQGTLFEKLKAQDRLSEQTVRGYVKDIIEALKYLHSFEQPILHRDIKPQNILLDQNGKIKLCDFGSANMKVNNVQRKSYVGTDDYMAPEMKESLSHDESLDIWCVGVLMYELLTGQTPKFENIQFPYYLSRPVEDLLKRILMKQPSKRIKLHEIEEHVWFNEDFINQSLSRISLGLQSKQSIREKNQSIIQKNNSINSKYSKSRLLSEKSANPNSSKVIVEDEVSSYMKKLKAKLSLISTIQTNNRKIEDLKILKERKLEEEKKQTQLLDEKIVQFKNNISILQRKKSKKSYQALQKLQQLFLHLNYLQEYSKTIPETTSNQALLFEIAEVSIQPFPISQSISKQKIQALKARKNALIELKNMIKRNKSTQSNLSLDYSFATCADTSSENLLK